MTRGAAGGARVARIPARASGPALRIENDETFATNRNRR